MLGIRFLFDYIHRNNVAIDKLISKSDLKLLRVSYSCSTTRKVQN